jgi:hypothetical protein
MRLLLILALAACQTGHDVKLLLGPDENTLSAGFLCVDETGAELVRQTTIGGNPPVLQFAIVVDLVTLGERVLGCRGEELVTGCADGECAIASRSCRVVSLELASPAGLLEAVTAQLAGFKITDDAPDEPVIVRVVAFDLPNPLGVGVTECPRELLDPATDLTAGAVGCAYSCPVELDNVDRVSVSLDTLTRMCEPVVRLCAGFPF